LSGHSVAPAQDNEPPIEESVLSSAQDGNDVPAPATDDHGTQTSTPVPPITTDFTRLGSGRVRFATLEADQIGDTFQAREFDLIWVSETLCHIEDKERFFASAGKLLKAGGTLVFADLVKPHDPNERYRRASQLVEDGDIKAIEGKKLVSPFPLSIDRCCHSVANTCLKGLVCIRL
jgi:SAM-dependent methyltransferase